MDSPGEPLTAFHNALGVHRDADASITQELHTQHPKQKNQAMQRVPEVSVVLALT